MGRDRPPFAASCKAASNARLDLSVGVSAVANLDDENDQGAVMDVTDDSVIADAISPELAELWSVEGFAQGARIVKRSDALTKKRGDAARFAIVELAELFDGSGREINPPGQDLALRR